MSEALIDKPSRSLFGLNNSDARANAVSAPAVDLRRLLIAGDAIAVTLAWTIPSLLFGSRLHAVLNRPTWKGVGGAVLILGVAVAFTLVLLATERLYLSRVCSMRTVEVSRIGRASVAVGLAALVISKLVGEAHIARVPIAKGVALFLFLNTWRAIYATWLKHARRSGRYIRPVLLIGSDEEAFNLQEHLKRHPELGYRIEGVVGTPRTYLEYAFDSSFLGQAPFLSKILQETNIKGAVIAGGAFTRPQLNIAVRQLLSQQVHVHMSTGIAGIDHRRMVSHSLAYEPMVYVEQSDLEGWQLGIKRVLDVVISAVVLILASPLMVIAAILVKLTDDGPVFFSQDRVGRHGTTFRIHKFRSMSTDAEARLVDLREGNECEGPLFKMVSDPRVTRIGKVIRATSVDELPQLLNVLKGEMSLVGPRPALRKEVEQFDEVLMARHNVLPGITGLWQVEARDNPDFTLYQRLDLYYVENWSVMLDLAILAGTAKVVALRAAEAIQRRNERRRDHHAITLS